MSDTPEPDQEPSCGHPRLAADLVGHDAAEAQLAAAAESGRVHHGWLITGPKGLGKATLAYRFARRLLGAPRTGPRPFDVDMSHPVARRVAALSHPDLFVLRRGLNDKGKPRRDIAVDDARALGAFFGLKPAEGGWRVAIIDCVDDLNRNAANALLKTLEEPPEKAVLLLVCHSPGGALATIRSRCRRLALHPLSEEETRTAAGQILGVPIDPGILAQAQGRPGRAAALQAAGGGEELAALRAAWGALGRQGATATLPLAFAKGDAGQRFDLMLDLMLDAARAAAKRAALAPDLRAASRWANAWSALAQLREDQHDLNMDATHALARAGAILAAARAAA
jgi:DNA polymerase-3 subunit delta'